MSRLSAWQHFCVDDVCSLAILYKNLMLPRSPQREDAYRYISSELDVMTMPSTTTTAMQCWPESCWAVFNFLLQQESKLSVLLLHSTGSFAWLAYSLPSLGSVTYGCQSSRSHFSQTLDRHFARHSGRSEFRHRAGQIERLIFIYKFCHKISNTMCRTPQIITVVQLVG